MVELPVAIKGAEGTAMEIEDCAFPTCASINIFDTPEKGFEGINWALLVGSKPRGPGMERNDLIKENGPIFVQQGRALAKAASDVRIVVVGNPCNTNALIAQHNSRDVPANRFSAMTMLDENRAKAQIAKKANVPVGAIKNLGIWGNHSSTMVPDFENAQINGKKLTDVITDRKWLENDFYTIVQKRGAAIIDARGKSSAASAGSACIDHVQNLMMKTPKGQFFSCAVPSDGKSYNVPGGLIYSFPVASNGDGTYEIVQGLELSAFTKGKMELTTKELIAEREVVKDLLSK